MYVSSATTDERLTVEDTSGPAGLGLPAGDTVTSRRMLAPSYSIHTCREFPLTRLRLTRLAVPGSTYAAGVEFTDTSPLMSMPTWLLSMSENSSSLAVSSSTATTAALLPWPLLSDVLKRPRYFPATAPGTVGDGASAKAIPWPCASG